MSADQPFNASAVAGVGAGISLATQFGAGALFPALQAGEPRVDDVASAVGRALDDPELRVGAARLAAEMAAQRSPAEAADLVEQLVATGEPVTRA
jgi:UDP:flavonoid glycosyltransferase YjiC (YdhE family)